MAEIKMYELLEIRIEQTTTNENIKLWNESIANLILKIGKESILYILIR